MYIKPGKNDIQGTPEPDNVTHPVSYYDQNLYTSKEKIDLLNAYGKELSDGDTFNAFCDFNYDDLPNHWLFLTYAIPMEPTAYLSAVGVIVEKYHNIAITYVLVPVRKPAAIFRQCVHSYSELEVGKLYSMTISEIYIPASVPALTDLYCVSVDCKDPPDFRVPTKISNDYLYITNMGIKVLKHKRYGNAGILYTQFGTVYVPEEFAGVFNLEDVIITGNFRYRIRGVERYHFACWELTGNFDVYSNKFHYATCVDGEYRILSDNEKIPHFSCRIGSKTYRFNGRYVNVESRDYGGKIHEIVIEINEMFGFMSSVCIVLDTLTPQSRPKKHL